MCERKKRAEEEKHDEALGLLPMLRHVQPHIWPKGGGRTTPCWPEGVTEPPPVGQGVQTTPLFYFF